MRVSGAILGMKSLSYQSLPLGLDKAEPGDYACQERYSQVDENAFCNLSNGYIDRRSFSDSQGCRQYSDENISVEGIKQHLEYGVEPHQGSAVLAVSASQVVPDYDHSDAAGKTYEDYAIHEVRIVLQENYRQGKHQNRTDDPVLHQGKAEDLLILENPSELFIPHLGQRREHHQNQAYSDRY